jgi:hypothetical protein
MLLAPPGLVHVQAYIGNPKELSRGAKNGCLRPALWRSGMPILNAGMKGHQRACSSQDPGRWL